MILNDFEKKLDYNQNNLLFLKSYYSKLLLYLKGIFTVKKNSIQFFLNDEFEYSGRDWYNRETWSVKLKDSIEYSNYLKQINGEKKYLNFMYN